MLVSAPVAHHTVGHRAVRTLRGFGIVPTKLFALVRIRLVSHERLRGPRDGQLPVAGQQTLDPFGHRAERLPVQPLGVVEQVTLRIAPRVAARLLAHLRRRVGQRSVELRHPLDKAERRGVRAGRTQRTLQCLRVRRRHRVVALVRHRVDDG